MKKLFLGITLFASAAFAQEGDAAKGKALYNQYTCYGCHGFSGQNGPGMRLVPMPFNVASFIKAVRAPGQPNRMPPYSEKVLTDAQLTDVFAYLKTLPTAPAAKDIPLLQQLRN
jgi:mono/diheme cytochrome c family protein